jgi:hypothetical protein
MLMGTYYRADIFQYPSIQTPDSHFDLPLCPLQEGIAAHTSGPPPKITTFVHYNHQLTIAAPSLTAAALLATSVRIEAIQDTSPLPAASRNLPPTREIADARGLTGKTLEDVREFQYRVRTRFLERCTLDEDGDESDSSSEIVDSERHDEDWHRLVCCYDPWNDQAVLRGKVWSPGTLSGSWDGRVMVRHFFAARKRLLMIGFLPIDTSYTGLLDNALESSHPPFHDRRQPGPHFVRVPRAPLFISR